jgi:hypothetical protein
VVEVQSGVVPDALAHEVDEDLEQALLRRAIEGPERRVARRAFRIEAGVAEQVLEPAPGHEGIALEVEEHVARARRGQAREPAARLGGQEIVERFLLFAPAQLHVRLPLQALVRLALPAPRRLA